MYFNHTRGKTIRGKRGLQYRCVSCRKWFPKTKITVDHIIPVRKGGIDCIGNLQGMCRRCNSSKGARLTVSDCLKAFVRTSFEFKLHTLLFSMFKRTILDFFKIPYKR